MMADSLRFRLYLIYIKKETKISLMKLKFGLDKMCIQLNRSPFIFSVVILRQPSFLVALSPSPVVSLSSRCLNAAFEFRCCHSHEKNKNGGFWFTLCLSFQASATLPHSAGLGVG